MQLWPATLAISSTLNSASNNFGYSHVSWQQSLCSKTDACTGAGRSPHGLTRSWAKTGKRQIRRHLDRPRRHQVKESAKWSVRLKAPSAAAVKFSEGR